MPARLQLPTEEINQLYRDGWSVLALSKRYGCSPRAIEYRLREGGTEIDSRRTRWRAETGDPAELIVLYEAGLTLAEIGEMFGCTYGTIRNRLKAEGVFRRRSGPARTYRLNEEFFDEITTEIQAYWLGFLLADGNSGAINGPLIRCELALKDLGHLEKLADAFETDAPIRFSRECVYISLNSAKLGRAARRLGMTPAKTGKHGTPDIREELQHHFYRGYFDGDGCLSYDRRNYAWHYIVTGAYKFICGHQGWLMAKAGVSRTKLQLYPTKTGGLYGNMTYGGSAQVERICDLLYRDATVYLERKFQLYQRIRNR